MRLFELRLNTPGPSAEEPAQPAPAPVEPAAKRTVMARTEPRNAATPAPVRGPQKPQGQPLAPWQVRAPGRSQRPSAARAHYVTDGVEDESTRPNIVSPPPPGTRRPTFESAAASAPADDMPWIKKIRDLTILFADLQGSTPLFEQRGDDPATELVVRYQMAVRAAVGQFSGRVVKTMGDGVMAVFEEPRRAVLAGMAIHEALLRERRAPGLWLPARIGIHRGPMIASELAPGQIDYLGHTVNVASRIQSAAEAGQLAVSDAVAQTADIKALLSAREVRTELRAVKGVASPLRLHCIGFLDELTDPGIF